MSCRAVQIITSLINGARNRSWTEESTVVMIKWLFLCWPQVATFISLPFFQNFWSCHFSLLPLLPKFKEDTSFQQLRKYGKTIRVIFWKNSETKMLLFLVSLCYIYMLNNIQFNYHTFYGLWYLCNKENFNSQGMVVWIVRAIVRNIVHTPLWKMKARKYCAY